MKSRILSKLIVLLVLALPLANVQAAPPGINKQQAVNIAQQQNPGRVLSIQRISTEQGEAWRIKTLTSSGDVHILVINATTGAVISR